MPHIVVFDLETRLMADELEDGWEAMRRGEGGISALAVWDSEQRRTYLYDDHCVADCAAHLESADLVVGFNSRSFDIPIVEGILGRKLRLKHHLDLLTTIWDALRRTGVKQFKGNKLGDVALRTIGRTKTGKGAAAPQLAKDGHWAKLFQYCMDDVDLTRALFEHALETGTVVDVNGRELKLELPPWLKPKEVPNGD